MFPGLPARVEDSYIAGQGRLLAKLLGLFTVADSQGGDESARGEFMRYFAEGAWYPTALLPGQGVRWQTVDDNSANATLTDGPINLTLFFRFNAAHLIASVHAALRGAGFGKDGVMVMPPWEGAWSDYQLQDGMMIRTTGRSSLGSARGARGVFPGAGQDPRLRVRSMTLPPPRHPWHYFALVYGLSTPLWMVSTQITQSGLPDKLPVTDIGASLTPTIAAAILHYREAGVGGVRQLFGRSFDLRRLRNKRWLVTAAVLFPLLYLVTFFVMRALDYPPAAPGRPSPSMMGVFLLFFVAATEEELGYSAYEADALQSRMAALNSALVMGALWALWHLPSMLVMGQPPALIWWGLGATLSVRILSVWISNNSGGSAFAVILMHAIANAARTGYPGGRRGYELGNGLVSYAVIMVFTVIVVVLWRPATLAKFLGRNGHTKVP